VTIDQVPTTYPVTLTDQLYVVIYGYTIGPPNWPRTDQVDDVYDAHPVIRRSTTTTPTSSTTETTTTPTHQGRQEKQKETTVTPVSHGDQASRPVHLSSSGGTQITNFLRDLPYKDEPIRWEPQHVGPRTVMARGGAGRGSRDKKRSETQGPPHCRFSGQEESDIDGQERVWEHGGTHTRRAGGVMPRVPRVVVQSRPRRQRSIPSLFRSQRGGWISTSVPKSPGYGLTKWLLARRRRGRAQRGG